MLVARLSFGHLSVLNVPIKTEHLYNIAFFFVFPLHLADIKWKTLHTDSA